MTRRERLVNNETIKLEANAMSNLGLTLFGIGWLTPAIAYLTSAEPLGLVRGSILGAAMAASSFCWTLSHLWARRLLRGLMDVADE